MSEKRRVPADTLTLFYNLIIVPAPWNVSKFRKRKFLCCAHLLDKAGE